ncbi:MAG: hypothetical protein UV74_C0013G0574 [Candidatus Woesebacteria bacterium GW2011_GWB1_43_14]|uniref:Uncharacterized protein n=1 Tax=Candidatus Woesebacteria bacterium GW2011_GWB1_43_14 TaxID=1618578 RepID=A0A0G1DIN0_9BACT|nr:MAG: hypothetical protein UT21_C0001G0287 [Candidatus Woesebacteria bacterium GW2011_GWA1_39_11b]KKS77969.1 MAG: hypothetical protein UV51_C0003G0004 [Candidatus Woesebacteria bacterium GW2011_GWC1_42_9]KKS97452.1 MAG: hypothetical protein UV74_C0013G0574 [Candidatus Woesebacteria bacterium GW2011_GWB1_43_14]
MAITDPDIKKLKTIFATKDDLKRFATKDELDDLQQEIHEEFQTWKSEFFDKIDPILKEVLDNREERTITNHRLNKHKEVLKNHNKRLHHLEASQV